MKLLVTTVRRILIAFLLFLSGIFGYDYYEAQTVGLPQEMALWDTQYRRVNARLLEVCDSSVRFQRLEDGRYFTVQFDDLSFLSSQRVKLFENSQAINGSTAAVSRIARLQSERKELLQKIEYLEARAEQTISTVEKRTLLREVERVSVDLLALERRLKEAGVELGYSAATIRSASSGIQAMGTQLIEFGSKISEKLR
ncbi:MAG: hypothetical protein HOO08_02770 [Opitutae bacterium]|jgi:hypothetical protein|nr:hypothetical protein [Opitutae bacterium]